MALRPIVLYPDPVLLTPTEAVASVDDDIRALVRDMVETMYAAPGIGLAANQVGIGKRVCVVDLSVGETVGELKVLINPRVVAVDGSEIAEEGCLSFPDIHLEIDRPLTATVEALDLDGRPVTVTASGLLARVMQHEIEHLDGILFVDHLSLVKRGMILRKLAKAKRSRVPAVA